MPAPYRDELALLDHVRQELLALTWPIDGAKIFAPSSVRITFGAPLDALSRLQEPIALIRPGAGTSDPDEPLLLEVSFSVTIAHRIAGDEIGENVVVGANQREDKGLLHVARQVLLALAKTTRDDAPPILLVAQSEGDGTLDEGSRYLAWRTYTFRARVGVEP